MPFSPTITHDSTSLPGVTFTVRRVGLGKRTEIDLQTVKLRQRMRELESDSPPASEAEAAANVPLLIAVRKAEAMPPGAERDAVLINEVAPLTTERDATIPPDVKRIRAVLDEEYMTVDAQIRAIWIRAGLVSIAGNTSGGDLDEMTADQLLEYGPRPLAKEIYEALTGDGRIRGADVPNSQSPTTSGGQADGASQSTTAADAGMLLAVGT